MGVVFRSFLLCIAGARAGLVASCRAAGAELQQGLRLTTAGPQDSRAAQRSTSCAPLIKEELGRLRDAMKGEATGTCEQDKAIGAVADAEEAAAKGDGPAALRYLKSAGEWTLGIAEKIGVAVATEALKKTM
jgi:hypothetical protein